MSELAARTSTSLPRLSHVLQKLVERELIFDRLDEEDVADLARIGQKIVSGMDSGHWILRAPGP